jgi:hypothetical protein
VGSKTELMNCFIVILFLIWMVTMFVGKFNQSSKTSQNSGRQYRAGFDQNRSSWQTGDRGVDALIVLDAAEHGVFFPDGERVFDDRNDMNDDGQENDGYDNYMAEQENNDPNEGIW